MRKPWFAFKKTAGSHGYTPVSVEGWLCCLAFAAALLGGFIVPHSVGLPPWLAWTGNLAVWLLASVALVRVIRTRSDWRG